MRIEKRPDCETAFSRELSILRFFAAILNHLAIGESEHQHRRAAETPFLLRLLVKGHSVRIE